MLYVIVDTMYVQVCSRLHLYNFTLHVHTHTHTHTHNVILLQIYRSIQRLLVDYKDARRGPTVLFLQSPADIEQLSQSVPGVEDFPRVLVPSLDRCVCVCV